MPIVHVSLIAVRPAHSSNSSVHKADTRAQWRALYMDSLSILEQLARSQSRLVVHEQMAEALVDVLQHNVAHSRDRRPVASKKQREILETRRVRHSPEENAEGLKSPSAISLL